MNIFAYKFMRKSLIILTLSVLILMTIIQSGIALDSDNDGLQDHEEIQHNTDIHDSDTDDDGIPDGMEKDWNKNTDGKGGINALDPDSDDDGIYDGTEMGLTSNDVGNDTDQSKGYFFPDAHPKSNTSMIHRDTDGDHIPDGEEDKNRNGKVEKHLNETDPNFPDRDNDNIADYEDDDIDGDGMYNDFEKLFDFDPYDPSDADDDPDNDGFTNVREYYGDDNSPGNNDWSDPMDFYSTPDLAPKVEFSKASIKEEANQTITIDINTLNVSDSSKDEAEGLLYKWEWGDGDIDEETVTSPDTYRKKHTFLRPGRYNIKLTVTDPHLNEQSATLLAEITSPIGQHETIYEVSRDDTTFKEQPQIRKKGWVALLIKNVRPGDVIKIEYHVNQESKDTGVGLRIFVIPEKNLRVYKDNKPSTGTISRKYNEYWAGHIGTTTTDGKFEITVDSEDDILVIFDNGYYEEYKDHVKINEPVKFKVTVERTESLFFTFLIITMIAILAIVGVISFVLYRKLQDTKGMRKITREAAIETQRSLDREMAQLEMEIQDSLVRGPSRPGQAPMPVQRPAAPPQRMVPGQGAQTQAPGTVPRTPTPATGAAAQVPGTKPGQPAMQGAPGTTPGQPMLTPGASPGTGAQAQTPGTTPGQTEQKKMLPPAQAPAPAPGTTPTTTTTTTQQSPTAQSPTTVSPTAQSPTAQNKPPAAQ